MNPACPVCHGQATRPFVTVDARRYWRCGDCAATYLDPKQRPDPAQEKAEYDQHQNAIDDSGYRSFLQPAADCLTERVRPGAEVLDYGCGPGPALAAMLAERGYRVSLFDPIYQPDASVFDRTYDAITCTEVAEHLHQPAAEFKRLDGLLRPGGCLVVMTRFQTDDQRFAGWHYRRDPTHVVFYRPRTFELLAQRHGWRLVCQPPNLALIQKPRSSAQRAASQQADERS